MAVAGMDQRIECRPVNWGVAGSLPGWGTCLVCRPSPRLGACERQPTDVSVVHPSFCLFEPPFPLSENKILKKKRCVHDIL